jgi:hypothetical protein
MASSEQPIIVAGEVTRADFDAAFKWQTRALLRRSRPQIVEALLVFVVMLILLLAIPFAIIAIDGERCATVGWNAGLFGFIVGLGAMTYFNRRTSRLMRALNKAGLGRHTFTFAPDGLTVERSSGASSHTPWTALKRMDVTPRHLAYWQDDFLAQFIPRAIVGAPVRETELLAAVGRWAPHLVTPNAGVTTPG